MHPARFLFLVFENSVGIIAVIFLTEVEVTVHELIGHQREVIVNEH